MASMNRKTKTQKEHYVNNKEFLAAMIDYKQSIKEAEKKKKQDHLLRITLAVVF